MSTLTCSSCHSPKCSTQCGACEAPLCKKCVQHLEKDSFHYLDPLPPELAHTHYCGACYVNKVAPALTDYEQTLRRAKVVTIFQKSKSEETRLLSRKEKPIRVENCLDERETLMRLAFLAVKRGCNAVVDVDIIAKKVRNEGYQTMRWQGSGIPTSA